MHRSLNHDMPLAKAIKAEAQRLGFELVGITTPDPPEHLAVFEGWLSKGRHGTMGYLESKRARQRRADPRQILPDCRSIVVLGVPYPAAGKGNDAGQAGPKTAGGDSSSLPIRGQVASYAWGNDYHEVLPKRLKVLVSFIESQVGHPVPNRWYTDTGPILERDLAQRAGLGWIGKNTCLIHPEKGSYFLLAEVLLGIDLEPDAPFVPDLCGTCTRCLDACPTACILPDRTIDARQCISYLTIELKSEVPAEMRSQTKEWVFGCDICQQVCPWNQRFAAPNGDPAFAARPGVPQPDLLEELSLSPQDFRAKFKGSPVKRAKRRGYLRNIAIALGNSKNPAAVAALGNALQEEPEPLVRGHAAWALGQIGGEAARRVLSHAAQVEKDEAVLEEIHAALDATSN